MTGQTITHYRILEKLGEGGMGVVYKAEDTRLHRIVAIKFLRPDASVGVELRNRFLQEAEAAAALDHPNVCTVFEIDEADGQSFLVMAYVDGESLAEKSRKRPLPLPEALDIAIQSGEGLQAAHRKGIVHRDVKSGNIMIDGEGRVKIMDFGLAYLSGRTRLTQTGPSLGTPAYMSPEQVRGEEVNHRSDIWSLGVVLHEMLTGQLPFAGEVHAAVSHSILYESPEPVTALRSGMPMELDRVLGKALAKNPAERYQHVDDMLVDLRQLQQPVTRQSSRPHRRKTYLMATLAALMLVIIAAGVFILRRPWAQPSRARVAEASIAVMPFVNLNAGDGNDHFSDGMTDELINALGRLRGLKVVGRSSVFRFKGEKYDFRDVGDRLKVATMLEGTVRQAGSRLRITAQLINVADGFELWSERFDREMKDVFDIQDEVARAIAEKLKIELAGGRRQPLVRRSTDNLQAYNLFLKGRYHLYGAQFDPVKSIQYLEQAKAADPKYAPAYAGLAFSYTARGILGYIPSLEAGRKSKAEAAQALEIDDTLSEAHRAMGLVRASFEWDWTGAESEFRRAIELNPGNADAHRSLSEFLLNVGRADEGMAEAKLSLELDPISAAGNRIMAVAFFHARQYDKAIEQARKTIELGPNYFLGYWELGIANVLNGNPEEGVKALERARSIAPGDPITGGLLGMAYAEAGRTEEATQILDMMKKRRTEGYFPAAPIAWVYRFLRDDDQCIQWLETAYRERDPLLVVIRAKPDWEPLRGDPRVRDILKRMGLEP